MASLEIELDRADKYYAPGEMLGGTYIYNDTVGIQHQGIVLNVSGYLDTVSIIRGKYGRGPLKESERIYFLKDRKELTSPGFLEVKKEIPFEYELQSNVPGENLVETYVGVDFSIIYEFTITVLKGSKVTEKTEQFYVAVKGQGLDAELGKKDNPIDFCIDPSSLDGSSISSVPKFLFEGKINSANCCITEPFDGTITVKESELEIKSLEVQLVRVETFEGKTNATEVQNIQVADGDVIRNLEIPLYMLFPIVYSSPTMKHKDFKIEFQVNIIVIFLNGYQLTESFEINIYR
ncbi:unnamed protein product [Moneuplotes crassus]|uniref:Vacuolar protein sorting-associated protein 26 n=3 Tax=Euplotes crassus TaxID=5936 RepID=A0AAD1XRG1_EUPCR|nr:unnamed protein product [Moneuplotes crassus]